MDRFNRQLFTAEEKLVNWKYIEWSTETPKEAVKRKLYKRHKEQSDLHKLELERREVKLDESNILKINSWEFSKTDERYKSTESRIQTNPKQDKCIEIHKQTPSRKSKTEKILVRLLRIHNQSEWNKKGLYVKNVCKE